MRDSINSMQAVFLGTVTVSGTTAAASSWVDTRGYDACTLLLKTNTVTNAGTADGFTATVQHGDDSTASGAAAITAADSVKGAISLTVTSDGDDDKLIGGIGYIGSKRYVRMNAVGTTGSDATVDVYAMLGEPARAATTLVGTAVAAT